MLELLVDTDDFVIINKPIDMPMHFEAGQNTPVIPAVKAAFGLSKLWLVHRLDTGTSGCIMLAKSKESASALSQIFAARQIQKYYLALIDKKPKKKQGKIVGDMQKSRNGSWKLCQSKQNPALTQFFTFSYPVNQMTSLRLCILKPHSGKTHQLRVALKSLGSPILGDLRYKGRACDRMYLHAYALAFNYKGKAHSYHCLPLQGEYFEANGLQKKLIEHGEPSEQKWPRISTADNLRHLDEGREV
ncbi:TIGR01621 family pseudouridine synthase [Glaciecola sp. MH2013]|uniref:TIGR01621 family pseudouridine synthase n=1 Tax=Glaciecola sp. MH2013 TaxID=2785524 RepID=UPI00189F8694|nr:TIGR01621 family pseudouridine synthase [Glaciecola sp. MH2013]MBF7072460.1 TIGR01621 family pseudouridine synthase [Glaciecola sp. MH2013]